MKIKKKKALKEVFYYLLLIVFTIFLSQSIPGYYHNVIYYAHLSTVYVCASKVFNEVYGSSYSVGAQTSYNASTQNITVVYYDLEPDICVIKHEECHKKQFEQHRLFNCRLLILNEIECYTIQRWYEFIEE